MGFEIWVEFNFFNLGLNLFFLGFKFVGFVFMFNLGFEFCV